MKFSRIAALAVLGSVAVGASPNMGYCYCEGTAMTLTITETAIQTVTEAYHVRPQSTVTVSVGGAGPGVTVTEIQTITNTYHATALSTVTETASVGGVGSGVSTSGQTVNKGGIGNSGIGNGGSGDKSGGGSNAVVTITETYDVTALSTATETASVGGPGSGVSSSTQTVNTGGIGNSGIGSGGGGHLSGGGSNTIVTSSNGHGSSSGSGSGAIGNGGGSNGAQMAGNGGGPSTTSNAIPPYTASNNGQSISCDYTDGKTIVYEYPAAAATAAGTYMCYNAIYEETVVIMNIVLMFEVTVDVELGIFMTITETSTAVPTYTPPQPPPPFTPSQPPPPAKDSLNPPGIGDSTLLSNETSHFPGSNYTSPQTNPSNIAGSGKVHPIDVSADGQFMHASNHLNATIGEQLQFEFQGTNVTVLESSIEHPCTAKLGGFNTGLNSTGNSTIHIAKAMPVTDTKPRVFFCKGRCSKETVLAVNVKNSDWFSIQEKISKHGQSVSSSASSNFKRAPMPMLKREREIPKIKSLTWWS